MPSKINLSNKFVLTSFIGTACLVAYLFYLDEGQFNFNWMQEPGAWLVFFIYWNIFFWPTIGIGFLTKIFSRK